MLVAPHFVFSAALNFTPFMDWSSVISSTLIKIKCHQLLPSIYFAYMFYTAHHHKVHDYKDTDRHGRVRSLTCSAS